MATAKSNNVKSAKSENLTVIADHLIESGVKTRFYGHEKMDGIVLNIDGQSYVMTGARQLTNEDPRNWDVTSNQELKDLKAADKETADDETAVEA